MGVSIGDYNRDGNLDIVKTNFAGDTDSLYQNLGDGTFEDRTYLSGLGVNTRLLGWGVGFVDVDNDGWLDILVSNGHVYPEVESSKLEAPYAEHKYLYRNLRNGQFEEVTDKAGPASLRPAPARGCAFGDFDNDGDIDVVVNCVNALPAAAPLRLHPQPQLDQDPPHRHQEQSAPASAPASPSPPSTTQPPNPCARSTRSAAAAATTRRTTSASTSASTRPTTPTPSRSPGPPAQKDTLKNLAANNLYVIQEGGKILKTVSMGSRPRSIGIRKMIVFPHRADPQPPHLVLKKAERSVGPAFLPKISNRSA